MACFGCCQVLVKGDLDWLQEATHFNRKELRTWFSTWRKACPSGTMKKDHFGVLWSNMYGSAIMAQDQDVQSMLFKAFDIDGNGKVDFAEFVINMSIIARGTPEEKIRYLFCLAKVDKGGYISESSMVSMAKYLSNIDQSARTSPEQLFVLFSSAVEDSETGAYIDDLVPIGLKDVGCMLSAVNYFDGVFSEGRSDLLKTWIRDV